MGNEAKVARWANDIEDRIKSQVDGIDFESLSIYTMQRWGFSDGMLIKYLDKLVNKGFIILEKGKYYHHSQRK
jgi:hypothetical protein